MVLTIYNSMTHKVKKQEKKEKKRGEKREGKGRRKKKEEKKRKRRDIVTVGGTFKVIKHSEPSSASARNVRTAR